MNGHQAVDGGAIAQRIAQLSDAHSDLDRLITKLIEMRSVDDLELRRLKKRKLKVKDTIILLKLQQDPEDAEEGA